MSSKSNQALPPKEMALFRKTVRYYEQKQYKLALRCTKQILSNPIFSEHGETLCMRGLVLNCIGKHDEAMVMVKKGVLKDIGSYVCWHVYGQVQRSDKKYEEAIKCYKKALALDNNNLQILRDLSLMQIQTRDYLGYRDSRYQLLVLRPGNKAHWVAYANACHMLGDYEMALKIVDDYLKNMKANDTNDAEHSDVVLYKVKILVEANRFMEALNFLEENATVVSDRLAYIETRADLLFRLSRISDAYEVYLMLIDRNPDGAGYYQRVEQCKQLLHADSPSHAQSSIHEFYSEMAKKHPRNRLIKTRALRFMDQKEFEENFLSFVIAGLRNGLPSLFNCVSPFYDTPEKISFVEHFLTDFVQKCELSGYEKVSLDGSPYPELASTTVWVYHFLAQHFLRLQRFDTALTYIDKAISHTPTLPDLYIMKAKIYKRWAKPVEAAKEMEYAQSLDTADRYINCKCTKYMLEAGLIEEASTMCQRFTREGMKSDDALYEMQCLWYALACAKAYFEKKDFGEALKRCHQIDRIMSSYYEEQYDLHTYCVRKCYMDPYVSLLHFLDAIHGDKHYTRAATIAARIYLILDENPNVMNETENTDPEGLSTSELKKLRRKANKQKAQEEKAREENNNQNKHANNKKRVDVDSDFIESAPLDPKVLLAAEKPLDEASKLLQPVLLTKCTNAEFCEVAFEVYMRKKKILLVLQCLQKLSEIGRDRPTFKNCVEKFQAEYKVLKPSLSKSVVDIAEDLLPEIIPEFNN